MSIGKKIGIGFGIFVLIIAIIAGLVYYSYTQIHVSLNDVTYDSIEWAPFSWSTMLKLGLNALTGNWLGAAFNLINGINLNLIFGLSNNGFLPVYIPDLSYDLLINEISVGRGYSNVDMTINPGQTRELPILQNFKKSSLSPAISSIVSTGGIIDLRVSGTAYFKFFGNDVPVPFESSKRISIGDEIKKRLNSEIQKNQQEQKNSITSSIKNSLGNTIGSISDKIFGTPDELNLQLSGQTIIDDTYRVGPGSYESVPITLSCDARIKGGFSASAALGDDIIVVLLDEDEFYKFQNDQGPSAYYNSGKVEYDTFDLRLNSGDYYIVMLNTYSVFSTKTVQLQVTEACQ